jgi:hypothetical protein
VAKRFKFFLFSIRHVCFHALLMFLQVAGNGAWLYLVYRGTVASPMTRGMHSSHASAHLIAVNDEQTSIRSVTMPTFWSSSGAERDASTSNGSSRDRPARAARTVDQSPKAGTEKSATISSAGSDGPSSPEGTLRVRAATISVETVPPGSRVGGYGRYYLSPFGRDTNDGTSSTTAWLTPNHTLRCGDVIIALSSTSYSAVNFASGSWGAVTCPAGNNVAWLECAIFDGCRINIASGNLDGMRVSASYWGVQGWEVTDTAEGPRGGNCFSAVPATETTSIHHVIFANDIANGCPLNGFGFGNRGTASVDYWVAVGNVAYRAGASNTYCGSGISAYQPVASDSLPGTHIYVAGNISYANTNPLSCYDGNGIIFDTFDGSQYPLAAPYSAQSVIDNNIVLSNGGAGVRVEFNSAGARTNHAHIYVRHNTMWNNNVGKYQYGNPKCGQLMLGKTVMTEAFLNLMFTDQAGCFGDPSRHSYVYSVDGVDGTTKINQNLGWSAYGFWGQVASSKEFRSDSRDSLVVNPAFADPAIPGAPNCGSSSSVRSCMAGVIGAFAPRAPEALRYGYQIPSSAGIYDPLFPRWLCNVNLPVGLVTMDCTIEASQARVASKAMGL